MLVPFCGRLARQRKHKLVSSSRHCEELPSRGEFLRAQPLSICAQRATGMRCYAAGSHMVLERPELIDSLQNEVCLLLHLCGR